MNLSEIPQPWIVNKKSIDPEKKEVRRWFVVIPSATQDDAPELCRIVNNARLGIGHLAPAHIESFVGKAAIRLFEEATEDDARQFARDIEDVLNEKRRKKKRSA